MGKYRPWILRGAIANAVVLCLLFNNPGIKTDSVWMYVYVAVFYVLWGMSNTLADIPYWSMIPSFATEEKDRNFISTVARTFSGLGQGIVLILTAPIVAYLGGSSESSLKAMTPECLRTGFGKWSIIAAVMLPGEARILPNAASTPALSSPMREPVSILIKYISIQPAIVV